MTPKQRGQKAEITSLILGMLSSEQKRRMENGEDISIIINELESWQKDRIDTSIDKLEELNFQQQRDFMFLRSGDLEDATLAERLVILQFLKQEKEEGLFTADELMGLAASFKGKEIKGGLFEELNHNPPAKALVEQFANVMGKSYQLTGFGETLESANAQYIAQNQAAGTAMATAMLAGAVSAAVDNLLYGPSSISLDPNSRLDNIERQGWDIKGSQSSMESPEVVGNPDGLAAGTVDVGEIITEIKYKPSSGVIFKANPNKTTTILGNYDRDMKNIINEMGNLKSTYSGARKGGFNVLNVPDDKYRMLISFGMNIT